MTLEQKVFEGLEKRGWQISFAESCTAGLVAARMVNVPSASSVFSESFVTYANSAKIKYLGVDPESIKAHGVVSEKVALEMAKGVCAQTGAQVGVGVSGIAGPGGGSKEKPVGTVCFGFCIGGLEYAFTKHFENTDRAGVRASAAEFVFEFLSQRLD